MNITGPGINLAGVPLDTAYQNYLVSYEITISDTNGCSQGPFPFDSTYISRPNAIPESIVSTYYVGDTVLIVNGFPAENPTWTVQSPLVVLNPNDFEPTVYSDSTGIYDITLTNEPLPGCSNSTTVSVRFADSLSLDLVETCIEDSITPTFKLYNTKLDDEGNTYIIGAHRVNTPYHRASYVLTKLDPFGDTIWHQEGPSFTGSSRYKVVFTDVEVDENGDLLALLSITSTSSFSHELINIGFNPQYDAHLFLVKLDGQTGNWISTVQINTHPAIDHISTLTTSDLLIDGDQLHISFAQSQGAYFITIDNNGNLSEFNSLTSAKFTNVSFVHYNPTNILYQDNFIGPEFRKLPNGDVIVAGYVGNNNSPFVEYNYNNITELGSNPSCIFIANYDTIYGLSNFTKLADVPLGTENFNFDVDANSNITFATSWTGGGSGTVKIGDSIMPVGEGSAVFQIDPNFDFNWISTGRYCLNPEVDIAEATGEIFVSGRSYANMAMQNGEASYLFGDYPPVPAPYSSGPYGMFIMSLNNQGLPQAGEWFNIFPEDPNAVNAFTFMRTVQLLKTVTPCGDIYAILNRTQNSNVVLDVLMMEKDGDTSKISNSVFWKYSSVCTPQVCSYLAPMNDIFVCPGSVDSLSIPIGQAFNVDSIAYNLVANGIVVETDTVAISNALEIDASAHNGPLEIHITEPALDTVLVNTYSAPNLNYTIDTTMCLGTSQILTENTPGLAYYWNNATSANSDYLLNSGNSVPGPNSIPVAIIDGQNCQWEDTLEVFVQTVATPTFASSYDVLCGQDTLIQFNNNDYIGFSWTANGQPSGNPVLATSLNHGPNTISVTLTDAEFCSEDFSFIINVPFPAQSNFVFDSPICIDDVQVIQADPASSEFFWDNSSISNPTFAFDAAQYGFGYHSIPVSVIDSNQCEDQTQVTVQVADITQPSFNSTYSVNCGQDLQINFNSNAYSSQDWTVNGNASQNPVTSSEFNPGLNTVNVVLTDILLGCTDTFEIIVDYCLNSIDDLSRSTIFIQPNPTEGTIQIMPSVTKGDMRYQLTSASGQLVDSGIFNLSKMVEYELVGEPGTYFLMLEADEENYHFKIVKL